MIAFRKSFTKKEAAMDLILRGWSLTETSSALRYPVWRCRRVLRRLIRDHDTELHCGSDGHLLPPGTRPRRRNFGAAVLL